MEIQVKNAPVMEYDAIVIPFSNEKTLTAPVPSEVKEPVEAALAAGKLGCTCGLTYALNLYMEGRFVKAVLVQLGDGSATNREIFLAMAKAFKSCKEAKAAVTMILLDNAKEITGNAEIAKKICELPFLVSYQFNAYKSVPVVNGMKTAVIVSEMEELEKIAAEAKNVAESTMLARDLINHPSMYMTPEKLGGEAKTLAAELGIDVTVYDKNQIEEMKMGAFLSVAKGAVDEPRVIVLRYNGGQPVKHRWRW